MSPVHSRPLLWGQGPIKVLPRKLSHLSEEQLAKGGRSSVVVEMEEWGGGVGYGRAESKAPDLCSWEALNAETWPVVPCTSAATAPRAPQTPINATVRR